MYATRTLAGAGFALNRRKGMDARIEKNSEHWLADKSDTFKNTYAGVMGAAYMGTSMVAGRYATEKITEWLGQHFGHGAAVATEVVSPPAATLEMSPAEEEAMRATYPPVAEAPVIPGAEDSAEEFARRQALYAETDSHIENLKESLGNMQKLTEEQANILKTMPDGSEAPHSGLSDSGEILRDNDSGEDVFSSDSNPLPSEAPAANLNDQELRALAHDLAKDQVDKLSPEEKILFNQNLDKLTPEELKTVDTYRQEIPEDAYIDPDEALKKIIEKQQLGGQSAEAPLGDKPETVLTPEDKAYEELSKLGPKPDLHAISEMNNGRIFTNEYGTAISTATPHIYSDTEGQLCAYGGPPEEYSKAIN